MNLHKWQSGLMLASTVVLFSAGITACSSTSNEIPDDGIGTATTENVFSSLKDLDYTVTSEQATITSGDMLDIKVFQAEELSGKVRVESNGQISLPLIGAIPVVGLTPLEAETKIKTLLGNRYLQNPQVTVFMESFTNQRVTLEGELKRPGVYPITGSVSLIQAIAMSEGLSDLADPGRVVLFRRSGNQTKAYLLNVNAIRDGKMLDPYIRGDDRIVVHRSDSRYWLKEVTGTIRGIVSPLSY